MTELHTTMPRLSRRSMIGALGSAFALAGMPRGAWARAPLTLAEQFPGLAKIINDYVAERKVAGMLAAIGFGDLEPEAIAAGAPETGSSKPVTLDTLWRIYSQTKPVTGIAAMMLIEDGKLKLDQPIADIFPEYGSMKVLKNPDGAISDTMDARTQITIRHLLTHTAGLGYTIVSKGPIQQAYLDSGITPGAVSRMTLPGFTPGAPTPDARTFARRLATLPLVYEPGTKWSYSVSLDLLGVIIAEVAGKPFEDFLQERLFTPLGMKDSFFQVPADRVADFSTNYAPFAGALMPIDPAATSVYLDKPAFAFGGGGMVSSARDYDKFLGMLLGFGKLGEVRVMSEAAARQAMSNLLPAGADTAGTWIAAQGFGAGGRAGLGTPQSPAGTFGWGGAAGTSAFVDTVRGFRAGGYTQYMPSNVYAFQADFPKYVYADLMAQANPEAL
jgi:CubicO group peptidase (beta-lactamase class C family)